MQQQTKQNIDGFPGLKDLPVLGALFRSRDFQNNETELVVMVTAYLVDPVAEARLARPDTGLRRADRSRDDPARAAERGVRHATPCRRRTRPGTPSATSSNSGETAMTKSSNVLRVCVATGGCCRSRPAATPVVNGPEQAFDVNQRFPIAVQPRMMTLAPSLQRTARSSIRISAGQLARFARGLSVAWLGLDRRVRRRPMPPQPTLSSRACSRSAWRARRSWSAAPTRPDPHRRHHESRYIRYVAEAPPCGDWSNNLGVHRGQHAAAEFRLRDPAQYRRHGRRSARSRGARHDRVRPTPSGA